MGFLKVFLILGFLCLPDPSIMAVWVVDDVNRVYFAGFLSNLWLGLASPPPEARVQAGVEG